MQVHNYDHSIDFTKAFANFNAFTNVPGVGVVVDETVTTSAEPFFNIRALLLDYQECNHIYDVLNWRVKVKRSNNAHI